MHGIDPPMFSLRVLGSFQLSRAGRTIDVPSRKLACLLAYLACNAWAPQPRERLATLLWGSGGDERARHNLRQALSRLRQVLGKDVIVSEGEAIAVADGAVACDAVEIDRLTRDGGRDAIAEAADLYGGALLEDVFVSESAWNDWLDAERERLSERAIGAMVQHGLNELAAGRPSTAFRLGQRAIGLNRFREDAHRLLLRSLAATGRTPEAIKHFHVLEAYLRSELDTEPDEETRRVVAGLGDRGSAPAEAPGPAGEAPASAGAQGPDVSRRRQVSVLVCGLVRPARSLHAGDPERAGELFAAFSKHATEVAADFGGYVATPSHETVHVYFGYPDAHEDDAVQAVRAGLAIVAAARGAAGTGQAPRARAGVATGLVVIGGATDHGRAGRPVAVGEPTLRAADLQALAPPGGVAISAETRALLGHAFDLGPVADGDVPEAWLVRGERDDAGRRDGGGRATSIPLAGRQEESDLLRRRWDQVRRGTGRVVLISGEPGIGKSRLAQDFLQSLDPDGPARLSYHCSPRHAIRPLHPYIAQIEASAGLSSPRTAAERVNRLLALVSTVSTDPARDVALLTDILTIPADDRFPAPPGTPAQKREMAVAAFLEWLGNLAGRRPVAILFEDIQWIDPTSLDLLDRTIARIADLPVLVIATMRPEHQPVWIGQPNVTMLHLSRLGREDSAEIIGALTRDLPFPGSIVDEILDRADGVPLFVNELTRHVMESGLPDDDGPEWSQDARVLPATLQSSLIARLDRLGEVREVALVASAIGRTFSHRLIAAVLAKDDASLGAALAYMVSSGLVSRTGTPPDARYTFTHALICDAAYGMMLRDQRRALHSTIADELIGDISAPEDTSAETIAHHLSEAGRTFEAVRYWVEASRAARTRWANREAAGFLDLALGALDGLTESPETLQRGIDLRFEIKNALTPLGEFDRIVDRLLEAKALVDRIGDPVRRCRFCIHMCQSLGLGGKSDEAIRFGEEARTLATSLGDEHLLVEALVFLGMARFSVMDYPQAECHFRRVLQAVDDGPADRRFDLAGYPEVTACAYLTEVHGIRGNFDDGIRYGEEAIRRAVRLDQPYSHSVALWCLADLHLTRGDIAVAIGLLERGLAISRQWDLPFLVAGHSGSLGYARTLLGGVEEGLPLLEQAIGVFDRMKHQFGLSLFLVPLGQACVLAGQTGQARDLARRALQIAHDGGHRNGEAGALHVLANAAVRDGLPEQARRHYLEALALAEKHGMRPLAARVRHGLGELDLLTADDDKARENLGMAMEMYRQMGMRFWIEPMALAAPNVWLGRSGSRPHTL